MVALAEGVSGALAGNAEVDVGADEVVAGVDDLGTGDLRLESDKASAAPTAPKGAEAKLSDRLERKERRATDKQVVVAPGQR